MYSDYETNLVTINYASQGLMEYVKPSWMERPRPVVDQDKLKDFGANVAPRPLNPAQNQLQIYPTTMEIDGAQAPRYMYSCTCTCMHKT